MASTALYVVEHISRYRYSLPVRSCSLSLCLKPRHDERQQVIDFNLSTVPAAASTLESDVFGNTKHVVNIQTQFDMLEVTSRSTVARSCADPLPDSVGIEAWDEIRSWQGSFKHWEFLKPSAFARPSDALASFVDEAGIKPKDGPLQTLRRLSEALHDNFQYVPGTTSAISPIEHILEWRQGVCQDYAHVMITVARGWGIPARYVSGYLYVKWQDYDAAPEAASHAWVECLLPSLGWVGFDPTNRCLADERHIRVGIGRDYQDVAPIRGIFIGGGDSELAVEVRVRKATASEP